VVTLALVVPASVVLFVAEPAQAATTRTLAITSASANPIVRFAGFDGNPLKVYDIDGDGDKEIIAQNDNQWVYVFDSRTGKILAQVKTVFPAGWGARSFNGPELSILSGDGKVHLVVGNSAATITSYTFDKVGSTSTQFIFKKDWERRLTTCYSNPGMDSKPVLHDLDKDGDLEILAATEESGIYALRMDGSVMWSKCIGGGNAEPAVADLNRDGWPDVVYGSDGSVVTAMNGRTGATMWSFWALGKYDLRSGSIPVGPAIGQLDGLGGPDIVVGLRDSHDTTNYESDHALLLALDSGGRVLWAKQDTAAGNPLTYTHPVIVDADKNGANEVYWADWNTIGHKGGIPDGDAWQSTGPANFYRYDRAGNLVWRTSLGTWWNNKDVPIADVDGDGVQEMLANGPGSNGHDGIWYLNTANGAKEAWVDLYPWKLARAPVVADLYGDGKMQWIAEVGQDGSTAGGAAILVYSTGVGYDSAWPHLPSPVQPGQSATTTTSPPATTTTSTTTTTTGTFAPQFTGFRGNEWWVQANVGTTAHCISKVEVRSNNGAWMPISKQSWGPAAWAGSYHFPQGSVLQMRATACDGQADLSSCRQWIPPSNTDATIVACPGTTTSATSTTTSSFEAAFTPKAVGNDWWVEADVTATKAIAGVDARVNSGSWIPLTKQSWGSWAKSINAPNGSTVTFRATSVDGEVATSPGYVWP
jgi:hypothetical protein